VVVAKTEIDKQRESSRKAWDAAAEIREQEKQNTKQKQIELAQQREEENARNAAVQEKENAEEMENMEREQAARDVENVELATQAAELAQLALEQAELDMDAYLADVAETKVNICMMFIYICIYIFI